MTHAASFVTDGRRFNYRVAGVCIHDDHVLLHRAESDDFWAMPGGRCHHGEASADAVRRELHEELGLKVGELRLLWFVENFFADVGVDYHELAFYYLYSLPPDSPLLAKDREHEGREGDDLRLIFRWFPITALDRVPLYPTFLRPELASLPASPCHVVHRDLPNSADAVIAPPANSGA
jgi:ADP-ribose pyrophosphatase YjhB (NUDIX family)